MKIYLWIPAAGLTLMFASCAYTHEAYYMSPSDLRSSPYVSIPMAADPEKTVTAAGISFGGGTSNQRGRDNLVGGSATLMQSHHFGHFQAYYGAAFGLGDYNNGEVSVGGRYSNNDARTDTTGFYIPSLKKYFGYYGFNGGINVVVPFSNGKGEWRALGIDGGYRREFGDYLSFRRSLPQDKIAILAGYGHVFTLGAGTEIIGRNARDVQFGYKVGVGGMYLPAGDYTGSGNGFRPYYFTQTFQVTKNRLTGYLQLVTGTHAFLLQTGVNVNLRKRTHIFPVPEPKPRRTSPGPGRERRLRDFEKRRRDESGQHD